VTTEPWDDHARAEQARLFRDILARLERGDPPMPTDIVAALLDEIEQRIDAQAIELAWADEDQDSYTRDDAPVRSRVVLILREIDLLKRAERDLLATPPEDRTPLTRAIEALARDPLPRGARALHGSAEGHVQHRIGRRRLLYSIRDDIILVVAVTSGPL
jgi:mRNA-degrading endonuclease RelE of RelBE toxin-antitoxin system